MNRLRSWLPTCSRFEWQITIADNGSTDGTRELAMGWERNGGVRVIRLDETGRGRALKKAWLESRADVVSYMDVDLSTDLDAFPQLIDAVACGGYDLAVGSRLLRPEWTTRCWKREIISRCYNRLLRALFKTNFSDAQCGFKALARGAADKLLAQVDDTAWFFDTELLVLAEKLGFRIYDMPVRWMENVDSRVKICKTALCDLRGIWKLRRRLR